LVIERIEGRYEAQDVPFGTVYAWHSRRVVIECDCGERLTLTGSATVCGCGLNHATTIRKELDAARQLEDEVLHPWRYSGERENASIPC
jgi:hypothetical protein